MTREPSFQGEIVPASPPPPGLPPPLYLVSASSPNNGFRVSLFSAGWMTDPSTVPLPPSRDSLDYPRPPSLANGVAALSLDPVHEDHGGALPPQEEEEEGEYPPEDAEERIRRLEDELVRTREEKEQFEAQYRSLLGKLTNMRNTLGDKLKQDAVSTRALADSGTARQERGAAKGHAC